jgi:hypothetical protein
MKYRYIFTHEPTFLISASVGLPTPVTVNLATKLCCVYHVA